ncbi:MAG: hypothetical protein P4L83_20840, partial [Nevskia sp.]|nr:hypothetical protein [Nevskia sp.]
SGGVAAAALAVLLAGALPHPARAQSADALPTQSLLDQLREKLLAPPECAPDCAEAARLWIGLGTDQVLNLRLSVDVQAPVAVPLPVPALAGGEQGGVWQPQRILVDGSDAALRRDEDGNLWIRLGVGRHEVLLAGDVAGLGQVQLPLPLKPHHVGAQLEGWLLSGIDDNGVAGDALQLLRQSASGGPAPAAESGGQVLPPLLRVTRSLHLGLDWQVDTAVQRLGVAYTAVNTAIPLLPGETVTSEDMRVRDAAVQLSLVPGETSASWTSRLAPAATLSLRAAPRDDVVEVWQFDIAPIWHAEFAGIAPVQHQDNSWWLPSFQPWPGESLQLALSRPQGLNGATLTLDTAQLTLTPGRHASDELLDLRLRSTQGGHYALPLEPGTTVTALTVNGASQPVQLDGGRLVLSLSPGVQQIRVQLRSDRGISAWLRTPAQALGLDGTNARLDLELPQDRWILLLGGPRLGPAVLFWGVLAVLFAIAAMLGRWRELPLRAWQWALLFVGLSQIPVWAAAVVVGWFAALAWRGRNGNTLTARRFKLTQAGLVLLTALVLALLFDAIAAGLLGQPEMQIAGNGSYGHSLHWYQDRCGNSLPQAWVLSTPLWVYRLLMLLWALWLANALLGWLRWAWLQFTAGGLWQRPVAAGPHPPPLQ